LGNVRNDILDFDSEHAIEADMRSNPGNLHDSTLVRYGGAVETREDPNELPDASVELRPLPIL
jgi:hypothetical protein